MACIVVACIIMAYIVMTCIVMVYTVMAERGARHPPADSLNLPPTGAPAAVYHILVTS